MSQRPYQLAVRHMLQGTVPLLQVAHDNLDRQLTENRRERSALNREKAALLAEQKKLQPLEARHAEIARFIETIDRELSELATEATGFGADFNALRVHRWVESVSHALIVGAGAENHQFNRSNAEAYVRLAEALVENLNAREGAPNRKQAAVDKLVELLEADKGKTADRFYSSSNPGAAVDVAWSATIPAPQSPPLAPDPVPDPPTAPAPSPGDLKE